MIILDFRALFRGAEFIDYLTVEIFDSHMTIIYQGSLWLYSFALYSNLRVAKFIKMPAAYMLHNIAFILNWLC